MTTIPITTDTRTAFIDITQDVQAGVDTTGCREGLVTVFVPHTTAGVTINEHADPDVMVDMEAVLDRIVPWSNHYRHAEGNTAAHVKASMMGSSVQVIVESGRLQLGTWQGIYFCEFDGPRRRTIWIRIA